LSDAEIDLDWRLSYAVDRIEGRGEIDPQGRKAQIIAEA
jgi:hypothetical protein